MSRTRIVKGKYIKTVAGNYNISAEGNISSSAGGQVQEKGDARGVSYGIFERLGNDLNEDFEISFSLKKDGDYSTLVPFGILDFKGDYENANFAFNYSLMLGNIDSLEFKILNEDGSTLFQITNLPEIVVTAKRISKLSEDIKNQKPEYDFSNPIKVWDWKSVFNNHNTPSSDYTKIGSYVIFWDGFDNNNIYDSSKFNNKKLKAVITASKNGKEKSKEVEFYTRYSEVEWVDVKIDKNNKKIDTTLRVNLKDGGEEGLKCSSHLSGARDETHWVESCPWDKIPKTSLISGKPPIKTRTRSFADLEKLAIDGINKHWSRIGKSTLTIEANEYNLNTSSINTEAESLNPLDLIYNTNGDWGRSGNAGVLGKIYYNVGYCNFLDWYQPSFVNEWGYLDTIKNKVDEDFMYTSAHELGHTILRAYGGMWYSFTHDDSSEIWQTPNGKKSYPNEKNAGEINLMHYFKDDPYQSKYDFNLIVASEKDVLSLIWLTKLKIN
jgi:hypothetical protein